jgi:multidrug efflux pump subunit AcrA (membrane-fusion protein)
MLNLSRVALCALSALILIGCDESTESVPTYTVQIQPLVVDMHAHGEIEAAQAQRIVSPGRQPMVIEWLAPENSMVNKGDVIARFDGEQIIQNSRDEELQMLMIQQDIAQKVAEQNRQVNEIESEQKYVEHEFDFVNRFAIDDIRVYSQLEIIETLQNKDFLQAKDTFLDWKSSSVVQQNDSEKAVLDIKRQGHKTKYQQHQEALSQLEVVAPYDGLLTYERDQRGEKPSVGQTVFPGHLIATIPNLEEMQARVYVLSRDAIGLEPGLQVSVLLDAFPDKDIVGTVKEVGGFPRSIERGSPITYYDVVVSFTEQNLETMKPGRKLNAVITAKLSDASLIVPLQALQHDVENSYVFVKNGGSWQRKAVTTEKKDLFFVEVTHGLEAGDVIALSPLEISG